MKRSLRVHFVDFWNEFKPAESFIYRSLLENFNLEFDPVSPQLLVCANFGNSHMDYRSTKLYFTGENLAPDFNHFDFAMTCHKVRYGDRHLRWPYWRSLENISEDILNREPLKLTDWHSKKFCNYIYHNHLADPMRADFFKALSQVGFVDSLGRDMKNSEMEITPRKNGDWRRGKIDAAKRFKFSICFENSHVDGYITEKLIDAYIAQTIPIYWGSHILEEGMNKDALILIHGRSDFPQAIEKIIQIENDPEKFQHMVNQPLFEGGEFPEPLSDKTLADFLENVGNYALNGRRYVVDHGAMMGYRRNQYRLKEPWFSRHKFRKLVNSWNSASNEP